MISVPLHRMWRRDSWTSRPQVNDGAKLLLRESHGVSMVRHLHLQPSCRIGATCIWGHGISHRVHKMHIDVYPHTLRHAGYNYIQCNIRHPSILSQPTSRWLHCIPQLCRSWPYYPPKIGWRISSFGQAEGALMPVRKASSDQRRIRLPETG